MELKEIIEQINIIIVELFDNKTIVIQEETQASDIEDWDSLTHISVITAIEKHFNIRFDLNELLTFNNIGDLCRYILKKTQG
jgi:acyl carrier protein